MSISMNKCPDAILTSDWHLRENKPKCRLEDDWMELQRQKLSFIEGVRYEIENKFGYICPILFAGDLFNHWKPSPFLISFALRFMPELVAIPGNHDTPAHNLERINLSGIYTLALTKFVYLVFNTGWNNRKDWKFELLSVPFGQKLVPNNRGKMPSVAMIHHFVYKGRKPFPGATGGCSGVMKKLKGFDLILSGDNHKPFTHRNEKTGQLLVNPGCLTRQSAAEADYKPRIYLWYARENEVEPVYLPINKDTITREHLDKETERVERISAYIEALSNEMELGLDFEANLREYLITNKVGKPIKTKIYEAMEK